MKLFFAGVHFFYASYAFIFLRLRLFLLLFIFLFFASSLIFGYFSPFYAFFAFLMLFFARLLATFLFLFLFLYFSLKTLTVSIFHAYIHTSPKKAHRWLFKSYKACR